MPNNNDVDENDFIVWLYCDSCTKIRKIRCPYCNRMPGNFHKLTCYLLRHRTVLIRYENT